MPHTKSSSRAVETKASDTLRRAITEGFQGMRNNAIRIEFGKYLTKTYGMPPATAYSKLRDWHVEEWEVIGFYNMIARFIREHMPTEATVHDGSPSGASSQLFPTTIEETRQWHATMPRGSKMKFYNYIAARGMCRERFNRLLAGKTTISPLKQDGLGSAFSKYVDSCGPTFLLSLGIE